VTTEAIPTELVTCTDGGETRKRLRSIWRLLLASGGARLIVLPVSAVCGLMVARLTTLAVGIDQFGVVMLVATLSQLLMFADLGAGAAVATGRARAHESPSGTEQFQRTMLTAIRTTLCAAVVLGVAAAVIGLLGAWPTLLGMHDRHFGADVNIAAVLTLSAFSVSIPFALGADTLRGSGRLHEAILLAGVSGPASLALTGALYLLKAPPLAYALPIPVGVLLGYICSATRARHTDRHIMSGLLRKVFWPRRFPGAAISATAAPMVVVMIGLPVALQSDRIVLSHRVDPASLSNYSYVAQLYTPLWSIISVAGLALWPHFAADNLTAGARRKSWLTGLAILGAAGLIVAAGFLLLSPVALQWMSAGTASPRWSLLLAFAALLLVQSLHLTTGIMLISPEKLRFQAACVLALVITNLPLSWLLAGTLGPAGPVLASAITVAACQLLPGVVVANRATSTRVAAPELYMETAHG
jgi:O-antigen/teichoic acid export membrane protein